MFYIKYRLTNVNYHVKKIRINIDVMFFVMSDRVMYIDVRNDVDYVKL